MAVRCQTYLCIQIEDAMYRLSVFATTSKLNAWQVVNFAYKRYGLCIWCPPEATHDMWNDDDDMGRYKEESRNNI